MGVAATVVVGDVEWEAAEADGDLRAAAGEEELDVARWGARQQRESKIARGPRRDAKRRARATRSKRTGYWGQGALPFL